jgi:antirestriction protein ArdC
MTHTVYESVTNAVIEKLEKGVIPWVKPWNAGGEGRPKNYITRKAYRGINTLLLGMKDYSCPFWATFKQIQSKGGSVNKGEHGTWIIYYKPMVRDTEDEDGEKKRNTFMLAKSYVVFNLEQTTGIDWEKDIPKTAPETVHERIERCEAIVHGYDGPSISHGGDRAVYFQTTDSLKMPELNTFISPEEYYSTLFHELVHSTGHKSRLNRKSLLDYDGFGGKNYSEEELVAEMGSAFICATVGIESKVIDNSASYISGYLERLKKDSRFILRVASASEKAVDFITANVPEPELV